MKSLADCLLGSGLPEADVEFLTRELESKIKSTRPIRDYRLKDPLSPAVVTAVSPVIKSYISHVESKQADIYARVKKKGEQAASIGSVYIDRLGRKPFINPREIKRGKRNKGKIEITLTAGRDKDGNIKPGKKKIVEKKAIKKWPGGIDITEVKADLPSVETVTSSSETAKSDKKEKGTEGKKKRPVRVHGDAKSVAATGETTAKAKTKKEISLEKYKHFIDGLSDNEIKLAGDLIIENPDRPAKTLYDLKNRLKETKNEGKTGEPKPTGSKGPDSLEEVSPKNDKKSGRKRGTPKNAEKRSGSGREGDIGTNGIVPPDVADGIKLSEKVAEDKRRESKGGRKRSPEIHPPPRRESRDYRITEADGVGSGGAITKARQNIEAIKILKLIESEKRDATDTERRALVKYAGWGGLPQVFDRKWYNDEAKRREANTLNGEIGDELKKILTEDEYRDARASTVNAHYTSPEIISKIWTAVERLGFKGGRVIEPGSGISLFRGLAPESVFDRISYVGVEMDSISSRIASKLHPDSRIDKMGYEKVAYPEDYFDLAISNVPFASFKPYDPSGKYDKYSFPLHDFFFAKAIDQVRPGGVVAFITSRYTMDKKNESFRRYLSKKSDFIWAIRLPSTAFKKNALTDVTTDIVFLRKKGAGKKLNVQSWENTVNIGDEENPLFVNEYFAKNKDMMLGKMELSGSMYGANEPTLAPDNRDIGESIDKAISKLPEDVIKKITPKKKATAKPEEKIFAPDHLFEGSLTIHNGKIYVKSGPELVKASVPAGKITPTKKLIELRDQVRSVLRSQYVHGGGDPVAERRKLNRIYNAFVKKYGPVSLPANKKLIISDPEYAKILALEDFNPDTNTARKTNIFTKDVIAKAAPVNKTETASEALLVSLNETGKVDIGRMAELTGKSEEDVITELGEQIFLVPGKDEYEIAEKYLSGNVKLKLRIAKEVAKTDPQYKKNVAALERIQPKDLLAVDITPKLGSPWIPKEFIEDFVTESVGAYGRVEVRHSTELGSWSVVMPQNNRAVGENSRKGTNRYYFSDLVMDALNHKSPTAMIKVGDSKVVDIVATQAAATRIKEIQSEFRDWLYKDKSRRQRIERIYNDKFNNSVERGYDGSFLTLPGSNPEISLRASQKNAVWRIIQDGRALLHHVVGSGKTWTMVAAGMEMKRLGLINRPMYVVPNHLPEQFSAEFQRLYPGANILIIGKNDVAKNKRAAMMAKMIGQDWDAVIIRQSVYGKIAVTPERESAYIKDQIDELAWALNQLKGQEKEKGGRSIVKQVEKSIATKKARLERLLNRTKKDVALYFEDLGIDYLFVDEAHDYKNLEFHTKLNRVSGLGQRGNVKKTQDMAIKVDYILGMHGGKKGATFATGTPISNTIAEMYLMLKYLAPDKLSQLGLQHFDSFIGMFGEISSEHEWAIDNSGYTKRNRLRKFVNVGEMMQMYRSITDIITLQDIREIIKEETGKDPFPKVKGGGPQLVEIAASPELISLNKEFQRLLKLWKTDQREYPEGNPLRITTMGKLAAIDMRTVDPGVKYYPNGKIAVAAGKIHRIWKRSKKNKGAQLVWLNSGIPGGVQFNLYKDLRNVLVKKGIQKDEIKFIHEYPKDEQKQVLYRDVRLGKVRVLIGSSKKMGTGMNVQERLIAAHHLEPDWRPADMEQRDGRIIRQGNNNKEVEIYWYSTKQSFDTFFWGTLETKAGYIGQILKAGRETREFEDIDKITAGFAEAMAVTSGNPLVKKKIETEAKLKEYELLRTEFERKLFSAQNRIARLEEVIPDARKYLSDLIESYKHIKDLRGDKFEIVINGKKYIDRKKANKALVAERKKINRIKQSGGTIGEKIGEITGLDIVSSLNWGREASFIIKDGEREFSSFAIGDLVDIISALQSHTSKRWFNAEIERTSQRLDSYKNELLSLKGSSTGEFKYQEELVSARKELAEIEAELDKYAEEMSGGQKAEKQFYIRTDSGFKNVDGEKVSLPNATGMTFFAHKAENGTWTLSEAVTGLAASSGYNSKEDAINYANEKFDKDSIKLIKNSIDRAIKEGNASPWYTPEGPGSDQVKESIAKYGDGSTVEEDIQEWEADNTNPISIKKINEKVKRTNSKKLIAGATVKTVEVGNMPVGTPIINSIGDAATLLQSIDTDAQESAYVIAVGDNGKVLQIHEYSKGGKASSTIEAFDAVGNLLGNKEVKSAYFAHNHPSGDLTPSTADIRITSTLSDILSLSGIKSESIIIGGGNYLDISAPPGKILAEQIAEQANYVIPPKKIIKRDPTIKLGVSRRKLQASNPGPVINDDDGAWKELKNKGEGFLLLDVKNRPVGFLPWQSGSSFKDATKELVRAIEKTNSYSAIVSVDSMSEDRNAYLLSVLGLMERVNSPVHQIFVNGNKYRDLLGAKYDYETFAGDKTLYQVKDASGGYRNIDTNDLLKHPRLKSATFTRTKGGDLRVTFKNGNGFVIRQVKEIKPDSTVLEVGYKQKQLKPGQQIGAEYDFDNQTITLSRYANKYTIDHELMHFMEESGLLSKGEIAVINKRIRKDGGTPGVEARAFWLQHSFESRDKQSTIVQKILRAIADFIDTIINAFGKTTTRGILRNIEKGKIQSRFGKNAKTVTPRYERSAQRWFSQMEGFLSQKLPNKAPAKQMANMVEAWARKGNFKADELEWSGLKDWLSEQKGRVTKDHVLNYLAENNVRIEEVVKGTTGRLLLGTISNWERHIVDKEAFNKVKPTFMYNWVDENGDIVLFDGETNYSDIFLNEWDWLFSDKFVKNIEERNFDDEGRALADMNVGNTKFNQSDLRTPGGDNYKEVLLTLPERRVKETYSAVKDDSDGMWYVKNDRTGDVILGTGDINRDTVIKMADKKNMAFEKVGGKYDTKSNYVGSHYTEPNILVHVRFDERTDSDGAKTLFIDEIQSDWAQTGRKEGFGADKEIVAENNRRRIAISEQENINKSIVNEGRKKRNIGGAVVRFDNIDFSRKTFEKGVYVLDNPYKRLKEQYVNRLITENAMSRAKAQAKRLGGTVESHIDDAIKLVSKSRQNYEARFDRTGDGKKFNDIYVGDGIGERWVNAKTSQDKYIKGVEKEVLESNEFKNFDTSGYKDTRSLPRPIPYKFIPNTPFKQSKQWSLLAMKRMVRWAAENGFEKIAWTPGSIQADRYDLSKQVDKITVEYDKDQTPGYSLDAYKDGDNLNALGVYTADELPGVIGKDLAEKIISDSRVKSGKLVSFKGQDLKVGGEGMKGFYDKILPATVNKFFNKKAWGKAKVSETEINAGDKTEKVWSLPITDAMRSKAMREGMPLFQRIQSEAKKITDTKAFKKWFGDSKVVDENGEPLVVYHYSPYQFTAFDMGGVEGAHFGTMAAAIYRARGANRIDYEIEKYAEGYFVYADNGPAEGEGQGPFKTKSDAESFARRQPKQIEPMAVYIKLSNPIKMDDAGIWTAQDILDKAKKIGVINNSEYESSMDSDDRYKSMRELMLAKGIDGVEYINTEEDPGSTSYIVFSPTQIKSIFNKGTFDAGNPDIRYQITETEKAIGTSTSLDEYFGKEKKKLSTQIQDITKTIATDKFWDKAKTQMFDRLHPIKASLGDLAYKLARNETGTQSIIAMFLRHGKLRYDPSGVLTSDERNKGFLSFIQSVGKDWDVFLKWVAARRAQNLEKEDRERWITEDVRKKIYKEAGADLKTGAHAKFEKYNKILQGFNNNILDIAQQAGLISAKARKEWAQEFYIPFYRLFEDKESRKELLTAPYKSKKFVTSGIRRLIGADAKIGDLQENMMRNWFHLIHESQRNIARFAAVDFALTHRQDSIIEEVKKVPGKDIWFVMRPDEKGKIRRKFLKKSEFDKALSYQKAGRPQYFLVHDPDLFNALSGINLKHFDNFVARAFGSAKRLLTYSATFGPAFRVANLLRDTMHTSLIEKSFTPFIDTWTGFWKSMREDQDFIRFAASGFAFGSSYVNADDPKSAAKFIKRISKKEGEGALSRIIDTPKKALDIWEKIGAASENAARVQLYSKLRKQGESHLEAAFRARDLLDFTMRGESSVVSLLIQTVPFLNARMQGLYKLGSVVADKETRNNLMFRGIIMSVATLALWSLHKDDDEYKELEDWDKFSYYHFWIGDKHYRIPKPFEVGAVFSSFPVAFADVINKTNDGKHIMDFIGFALNSVFSIDVPQLVKPAVEQWANKSFFTGRPIVSRSLEGLPAGDQADPWTSELAKLAGKLGISPKRAEHLVRSYFSVIGMGVLSGTDYVMQNTMNIPEDPTITIGDWPLFGRFIKRKHPARYTRYQTWFYETIKEMDSITRAVNEYKRTGQIQKAQEYTQEHIKKIRARKQFLKARRRLSNIRKRMKTIYSSNMSPSEKRKLIDRLSKRRNEIVKKMYEFMRQPTDKKAVNNWNARARKEGRFVDIIS